MAEHGSANLSARNRRAQILDLLDHEGEQGVESLAERFGVSGMTIRRDLQDLADAGKLIRTHGGAAPTARISFEFRFLERGQRQAAEKQAIARVAVDLVKPGQTVLLDSGTTTLAIARRLKALRQLTVITTSLPIASELFGIQGIELILLGGRLRKDSPDLVGAITDLSLETLRADVAFIGADAIDEQGYIYNASADVGRMLTRMAASAAQVYAVADHTKIGSHELMRFANLREWCALITDTSVDAPLKRALEQAGVNILLPSSAPVDDAGVSLVEIDA